MAAVSADAAERQVEEIVRRAGTSFYQGMRILEPPRRRAMYGIYAFCRVVDDIADEPGTTDAKHAGLDAWRGRIAGLYAGASSEAITAVLQDPVTKYGLRQEDFLAIIDGMQTDADTTVFAPTLAELDLYCDRVASAVGRLSVRAFGDGSPRADDVAWALGRALQFTNILRDLHEDAGRGRLYLPGPWLDDAGMKRDAPERMLADPALPAVCQRMEKQARRYFAQAEAAMRDCNRRAMRPARLMAASYRAQLDALETRGWARLDQPVKVPKWRKLWFVARHTVL